MINKLFIGLRSWPTSLLKNNVQPAKRLKQNSLDRSVRPMLLRIFALF